VGNCEISHSLLPSHGHQVELFIAVEKMGTPQACRFPAAAGATVTGDYGIRGYSDNQTYGARPAECSKHMVFQLRCSIPCRLQNVGPWSTFYTHMPHCHNGRHVLTSSLSVPGHIVVSSAHCSWL